MKEYEDPMHEGNGSWYETGKACIEDGCNTPAGTRWSPLWCFHHNVERLNRVDGQLRKIQEGFDEHKRLHGTR